VNKTSFAKHIDNLRLVDEEDIEAERKDFMNKTASLSKDEMGRLLRSMGIAMKEFDLKALIDAFDADGGEDDDDDYVYDGEDDDDHYVYDGEEEEEEEEGDDNHHDYDDWIVMMMMIKLMIVVSSSVSSAYDDNNSCLQFYLISALLSSSDGRVTLSEFLDFTGPKRDRKGM